MQNLNKFPKIHKAKKSLGQNFLKSVPALNKIIEVGEIKNSDTILEIGPGKGALTAKLLENAGLVIAIEKDRDLLETLREKFAEEIKTKRFMLIEGDALEFEPSENGLKSGGYKVIANIPYNITGAILKKFLAGHTQPERMVLMVQKEVAERVVARDGKESILSISVRVYGDPKLVMKVPARYFSPAPKVDSAIISISGISRGTFQENNISEEVFWEIVKTGFAHKRKMLSGNLKNIVSTEKITKLGLENSRAENLKLEDWINLAKQ